MKKVILSCFVILSLNAMLRPNPLANQPRTLLTPGSQSPYNPPFSFGGSNTQPSPVLSFGGNSNVNRLPQISNPQQLPLGNPCSKNCQSYYLVLQNFRQNNAPQAQINQASANYMKCCSENRI